jgi:hypothetical protein
MYGSGGGVNTQLQTHHFLWILVALEVGALIFFRAYVFKRYHGG